MTLRRLAPSLAFVGMLALLVPSYATADVAPPPKTNECKVLPLGSPCWIGTQRGVCDENPDFRERTYFVCRIGVTVTNDAGVSDAGAAAASNGKGACAVGAVGAASEQIPSAWTMMLVLALRGRRRRCRRSQ